MFSSLQTLNNLCKNVVSVQPAILTTNLVLRYDFSNSGTTILDKSGNSRNATMNGTNFLTPLSSYPSSRLQSNNSQIYFLTSQSIGSASFISLNSSFSLSTQSYSFSFWLYPLQTTGSGDCKVWESVAENIMFWRGKNANPFNGVSYSFGNLTPYPSIAINTWSHVVITCNFSTLRMNIYVNNVLSVSNVVLTSSNFYSSNNVSALNIGRSLSSGHFSYIGGFADFRLYNTVLDTTSISAIYNGA